MSQDDEGGTVKFERPIDKPLKTNLYHKVHIKKGAPFFKQCRHKGIEVDRDERRVYCIKCGVELDPIQCLIDIAYHEKKVDERIEMIRQDNQRSTSIANRKAEFDRLSALKRIKTLQPGEWIYLESKKNGISGKFVSVDEEKITIQPEYSKSMHEELLTDVLRMRRVQRERSRRR